MYREPFPMLYVSDIEEALHFYCDLLGFSVSYRQPPEGPCTFAFLKRPSAGIGLTTTEIGIGLTTVDETEECGICSTERPQLELRVQVNDVDEAAIRLLAQGVPQLRPPTDQPWGERTVYVADPDGHPIQITAPAQR